MNGQERRNDWAVVAAVALIALGVWFLLGNIFGPWWQDAIRRAFRLAWPLALIALGVLIYLSSTRGSSSAGSGGRRVYRSSSDRMIGGVLAGFANYIGTDPTLVRILYVVFGVLTGVWLAILVYVVAMVVIPEEPAGGPVQAPSWPQTGPSRVEPSQSPSTGWPHTGTETVQVPPPPPPATPAEPAEPAEEAPPAAEGPAQS